MALPCILLQPPTLSHAAEKASRQQCQLFGGCCPNDFSGCSCVSLPRKLSGQGNAATPKGAETDLGNSPFTLHTGHFLAAKGLNIRKKRMPIHAHRQLDVLCVLRALRGESTCIFARCRKRQRRLSDSACVRLPLARPDAAGAAVEYGGTFESGVRFGGVPATGNGG